MLSKLNEAWTHQLDLQLYYVITAKYSLPPKDHLLHTRSYLLFKVENPKTKHGTMAKKYKHSLSYLDVNSLCIS